MILLRLSGHLRANCWRASRKAVSAAGGLLAVAILLSGVARASCLDLDEPRVLPLQELSIRDPKKALETVKLALAAAERAATKNPPRIAALYAIEAESYSLLELDADARSAALKGLESAPEENDPTHLTLLMLEAENIYDAGGLDSARVTLEKAQSRQIPGSRADLCLQITLGQLQNRSGRSDLAILTLTRAYRTSLALAALEPRVLAAAALSPVMRAVGDFKQALALNQEVIDWDLEHNATLSLSVARYLRGQILSEMHDYSAAVEEIQQARQLSVELADEQGVAFAELATCRVRLELGQLAPARTDCESALRIFVASRSIDMEKESQTLLARLDLAEGHADRAIARLNEVLSRGGEDMQPRQVPSVYEVRAQANATLQKYPEAYRDLSEYLQRYTARNDAERAQQVAALRARFETDREIERNTSLQRELSAADERTEREKAQVRRAAIGTIVSVMIIALLTYLLVGNLRFRKQLVRLATEDSLTGVPNRGRTAALAIEALAAAFSAQRPLSIALIDLDRFKTINDRFGHATGDYVLKEFASMTVASIRATDILGRWGGEEFLLVLPDTTLDVAVEMLDHLRLQAGLIRQPLEDGDLRVSISAGLATTGKEECSLDEIVARADVALYEAKDSGRDLVRYAEESYRSASTGVRRALRAPLPPSVGD
jgi:diguanylate cyclase (GGDEF)-like protein